MRVGFDEQILLAQPRGGISRYVVSLVGALASDPSLGVEPVMGWARTVNDHAISSGLSGAVPKLLPARSAPFACYLGNARARRVARRVEILHHTYYHPAFLARRFRGLRVSTVHDMTPELYPELFPARNPHLAKARYVEESDLVICNSEATRNDLLRLYGTDPSVTAVVPLGVDSRFGPGQPRRRGLPERYVLYVGSRASYKSFDVLLEAFAGIKDDATTLVVVGEGLTDSEIRLVYRLGLSTRVITVQARDHELPAIYANALLLAFPSAHEGFGLPTLEAMASGIPVVLSNASSHPEVGGSVARYFRPGDALDLRGTLDELADDAALRADLGARGVAHAAQFTWRQTAVKTACAYHKVRSRS